MWTVLKLLDPDRCHEAKYYQGYRKQLVSDFFLRSDDRAGSEIRADEVLQTVCDARNYKPESYDGGRVMLIWLGHHMAKPYAVKHTQFGPLARFFSIEAARAFFREKAKPIYRPRIPVCEDCEIVFRNDVPTHPHQPACPCCGATYRKIFLGDLDIERQRVINRNSQMFFYHRTRHRVFKKGHG